MGRHLGLSEAEFWASTLAKIMALYEFAVNELGRKRDFFPAFLLSAKLNSMAGENGKSWEVNELLEMQYPAKKESVVTTHDPDMGAAGDWVGLKQGLKSL